MSDFQKMRLLHTWRFLRFLHFYLEWITIYEINDNVDTFSDDVTQLYYICWGWSDSRFLHVFHYKKSLACLIFTCPLHILVAKVTLFEQCRRCWTIFSHRSLALLLTLDFESNTECCWGSTQTPLSLYGTHCCFHSLLIISVLSLIPSLLSFAPLHLHDVNQRESSLLVFQSITRFYTNTHSHIDTPAWRFASGTKQATDLKQQLDLVAQTEQCPYIGSSFG